MFHERKKKKIKKLFHEINLKYNCTVYSFITADRFNNPNVRKLWYGNIEDNNHLYVANMEYKFHECKPDRLKDFYNRLSSLRNSLKEEFDSLKKAAES